MTTPTEIEERHAREALAILTPLPNVPAFIRMTRIVGQALERQDEQRRAAVAMNVDSGDA